MARGGGAFVVAALLERVTVDGTAEECGRLHECISVLKDDEDQSTRGWATLSEGMRLLGSKASGVT